jgi:hypothetical protein
MGEQVSYDEMEKLFQSGGVDAALDGLLAALEKGRDHHALFRARLLKKRHELGLPLINPGDLAGQPDNVRSAYREAVDCACREAGERYLRAGDIATAWRYYRSVSEREPIRAALDKLEKKDATEDLLKIALDEGVHPRRGFELRLERDGIGAGVQLWGSSTLTAYEDRQYAAGLLVRALYKEVTLAVCKAILARGEKLPDEPELVELIRERKWLFDHDVTHADPYQLASVARIGLICEAEEDLITTLSLAEYGRQIGPSRQPSFEAPFDAGFSDYARFARAVLGEGSEEMLSELRGKLYMYQMSSSDMVPVELTMLLMWRTGFADEALDIWQQYLGNRAAEQTGQWIPSYYDLCARTESFMRLADMARIQDDWAVWGAAQVMEQKLTQSRGDAEEAAKLETPNANIEGKAENESGDNPPLPKD